MFWPKGVISDITEKIISALQKKHSGPNSDSEFPTPQLPNELRFPLEIEREVTIAIHSFPCGSAGGPDGI